MDAKHSYKTEREWKDKYLNDIKEGFFPIELRNSTWESLFGNLFGNLFYALIERKMKNNPLKKINKEERRNLFWF